MRMMMEDKELKSLLAKYKEGTCSAEEKALLENWAASVVYPEYQISERDLEHDLSEISRNLPLIHRKRSLWPRIAGIAAAVIGIAVCVWLYTARYPDPSLSSRTRPDLSGANAKDLNDIAPGGNRATLTSNGNTINLSESKTGLAVDATTLAYNDGTKIDPRSLGTRDGMTKDEEMTVQTPRGGMYSIILQDGTKVWLNSDSKLEFFSNYRNKLQRIVKLLAGEAYFEVAKDIKRPFRVESNGQIVEVLGTHFNISAYKGETIRTTLLEGSVAVTSTTPLPKKSDTRAITYPGTVLEPNEESTLNQNNVLDVKRVDAAGAITWKDGMFQFNRADIKTVMRQLARWYDVEVSYEGELPRREFTGKIFRNVKASQALDLLKSLDVNFRIEGKKIIVTK